MPPHSSHTPSVARGGRSEPLELGVVRSDEYRGLYWATTGFAFPTTPENVVLPREWVATSPLFVEVDRNLEARSLAEIAKRLDTFSPQPTIEKCVAEAIYERARKRVLPDAPSR